MIDRYLDGKEHLFSKTGAQLATEGITRNGQFKNHKDKKFDWQFNGRNVLDFIPDGWKEELNVISLKWKLQWINTWKLLLQVVTSSS